MKAQIRKLVEEGIYNYNELRRHVKLFVKGLFGSNLPQNLNRRFYPSKEDIRKIVYRERKKLVQGKIDQERLKEQLEQLSADEKHRFFFRPSTFGHDQTANDSSFLLVYQNKWQQRLLKRYGGEMVFLDATYRTTRYSLPLFFVCVYTNCGYFVVASLILETEDSSSLSEAFDKLKEMNVDLQPSSFMIDASEIEMNAIKSSFPGILV